VQTIVETPTYLAIANKLFSEEERVDIVALVAADPECGDLIRGTGGFRKVRVARKGMGKSGGARVVYVWRNERFPVFLIAVFPKNQKENLSMAERNALKKRADTIFDTYGGSMKTQFEQMMDGLNDVEAFLGGKQEGFSAHVPQDVDVKAIRNRLGMTQAKFSDTFGFSLDAIKHWEGGRRTPEAPARTLLTVIDRNPGAVLTALNPAAFAAAVSSSKSTTVRLRVNRKRQTSGRVTKRKTYSADGGKRMTK
jgi:DNA-binding transcriptional regulator YiaG